MMGFVADISSPVFVTGLLIAASLLFVGLGIGVGLGRRSGAMAGKSLDDHVGKMLQSLFHWTDGFASDVSRHRQIVDSLKRQVRDAEQHSTQPEPGVVVRLLSRIVQANDMLQQRLDLAEQTLKNQAAEITSYMSEARTDTLTSLPNRRVFDDDLARRIAEFRRHGTPLSVLLIDIDHFKKFNDRHGHLAGDAILAKVASVLRDTMRESDLVTRLGGEEFAILLPGTDVGEASEAAERARLAIDQAAFQYEGKQMRVTVSCGVAKVGAADDAKAVVKRADQALYASKSAGRNFAHWHNEIEPVPITARPHSRGATRIELAAANSERRQHEFSQVCNELRQRLLAVVRQQA
jgi:diguanylate cyclase